MPGSDGEWFTADYGGTLNLADEALARVGFAREQLAAMGLARIAAFKAPRTGSRYGCTLSARGVTGSSRSARS